MVRILVPTDGSEACLRAVDHAARRLAQCGGGEIHLLNVQPPIPASVGDFVGGDVVESYHAEEGEKALREARERAAGAGISCVSHVRLGSVAETVADYAGEAACDEIVMGSRGLGSFSGLVLGSVTTRVLHLAAVPVTVVK